MPDSTSANSESSASNSRLEKSKLRLEQAIARLENAVGGSDLDTRLDDMRSENAALRDAASTVSKRLDKVIEQLKTSVDQE